MNEYNNLSVLPFYGNENEQNARKWWVYGRIYPLFCGKALLPFQFSFENPTLYSNPSSCTARLYKSDGTEVGRLQELEEVLSIQKIDNKFNVIFQSLGAVGSSYLNYEGQYYIKLDFFYMQTHEVFCSEVFTLVMDLSPYVKITWWDTEDLITDDGIVKYNTPLGQYKNFVYLQAEIAKPEYVFEDETEDRDGYSFPIKQISKKKYRFSYIASEYMLDVMRFIRMADFIEITYNNHLFKPNSFLITPEWVSEGDVATVNAEFETDTVIKKLGVGYVRPSGGDYNEDYGPEGERDFSPSSN